MQSLTCRVVIWLCSYGPRRREGRGAGGPCPPTFLLNSFLIVNLRFMKLLENASNLLLCLLVWITKSFDEMFWDSIINFLQTPIVPSNIVKQQIFQEMGNQWGILKTSMIFGEIFLNDWRQTTNKTNSLQICDLIFTMNIFSLFCLISDDSIMFEWMRENLLSSRMYYVSSIYYRKSCYTVLTTNNLL